MHLSLSDKEMYMYACCISLKISPQREFEDGGISRRGEISRKYCIRWCVLSWVKLGPANCQHSSTRSTSYELNNSWEALVYRSWNYYQKPLLAEKSWKSNSFVTRQRNSLDRPCPNGISYCHFELYSWYWSENCWGTNTNHAECGQLSIRRWILLFGTCAY